MENQIQIQTYIAGVDPNKVVSIIDLEIKEYEGLHLQEEEKEALNKFYKARIKRLKKKADQEASFHERFEYYRAISNLVDYRDILSEKVPL